MCVTFPWLCKLSYGGRNTKLLHFSPFLFWMTSISTQSLLNRCTNPHHLHQIHARFILHGLQNNPIISSALTSSYANLPLHPSPSLFSNPDYAVCFLRSIASSGSFPQAKSVHSICIISGSCHHPSVSTALLSLYSKTCNITYAGAIFEQITCRDVVVWNLMIQACSRSDRPEESLFFLKEMTNSGVRTDVFTTIAALSSISHLRYLKKGKEIHANVVRNCTDDNILVANSLIHMYLKCDCLLSAEKLFYSIVMKTRVSWSSMIMGYASHGRYNEALSFFVGMKSSGVGIDHVVVINLLPACMEVGSLENVRYVHGNAMKLAFTFMPSVGTAFVVGYAGCGSIEAARKVFEGDEVEEKDILMWNSMIGACCRHGEWLQCFEMYERMKRKGVRPDKVTYVSLLSACVNSGLVEKGWVCFKEMVEKGGFEPTQEHYACMVDLLGRYGMVEEAAEVVKSMPYEPDAQVWGPLLGACKKEWKRKLVGLSAEKLISSDPRNPGNYIMLSNMYAAAGMWEGVAKMRTCMRDRGLKKTPGCSWIDVDGRSHEFRVADRSHPKWEHIYRVLRNLELRIRDLGDDPLKNGCGNRFFAMDVMI